MSQIRQLRALLHEGTDILHTTLFDANIVGRIAAARSPTPVLTSLVNTPYHPARLLDPNVNRLKLSLVRGIDAWSARRLTTWFHAITHAVKDAAVDALGIDPARISVVERGRSPDRLGSRDPERRRSSRRRLGLKDEDVVLVNVARQEYQKGQRYLLEAISQLTDEGLEVRVLICGREGHATPELQRIVGMRGLGSHVRFLGDRNDVPEVLAAADLFVFPSIYEGLGGAVVEAMGMGLPIICFDVPALREVVESDGNARIVPLGDVRALASAIAELCRDQGTLQRFGRRSREIFLERFTLENSARRMIDLYSTVVSYSRSNPKP